MTLMHVETDRSKTAQQAAEAWVKANWGGQREIESWTGQRFSLVYGASVYEVRHELAGWAIYRHEREQR